MLQPGTHVLHLNPSDPAAFAAQGGPALLAEVTHSKVLAQLRRFPLYELELRPNLGGDAGQHHVSVVNGQRRSTVWVNTTPRVPADLDITHAYAATEDEYRALVLLHELGHVLADTMKDAPARDTFLQQLNSRVGVTDYARGRFIEASEEVWRPKLGEYVAETFTAAVSPQLKHLHARDQPGVEAMTAVIASW